LLPVMLDIIVTLALLAPLAVFLIAGESKQR
jgi:hypothetical protein